MGLTLLCCKYFVRSLTVSILWLSWEQRRPRSQLNWLGSRSYSTLNHSNWGVLRYDKSQKVCQCLVNLIVSLILKRPDIFISMRLGRSCRRWRGSLNRTQWLRWFSSASSHRLYSLRCSWECSWCPLVLMRRPRSFKLSDTCLSSKYWIRRAMARPITIVTLPGRGWLSMLPW
jgi:hypothetical protein